MGFFNPFFTVRPAISCFQQKRCLDPRHQILSMEAISEYVSLAQVLAKSTMKIQRLLGGVPKIGVPQNGWLMENLIKMDDLGLSPFKKHPYI